MHIPFKKEHLEVMTLRPHEERLLRDSKTLGSLVNSYAVTGILDGRVVCCGGILPFGGGNAEIWLIPSVYLKDYTLSFCRELKDWLFQAREDVDLKRLQSTCLDDELHSKWMTFLGFKDEGLRKCYYDGVDYRSWGRVWE
jgi:hypothetical protein